MAPFDENLLNGLGSEGVDVELFYGRKTDAYATPQSRKKLSKAGDFHLFGPPFF